MKFRKMIVFMLAVSMAVNIAGCADSSDPGTSTDALSSGTDISAGAPTVEEEKNLYGYDEPVSIKIAYRRSSGFTQVGEETIEDNSWMRLYRENNIFPEVMFEEETNQYDRKLSTAIMSGNYPDIMWATSQDYMNWIETGVIADITDVFEEYASEELKAYVNADGGVSLKAIMHEGRMYGIPFVGNPYNTAYVMFIRQDWLDNLGLQVPETMEELKEVAYAFTYDDPDQNGKDDTYGLAFSGGKPMSSGIGNLTSFFSGYGAYLGYNGTAYVQYEKDKITWGGTNAEGMKAGLKLLQEMYREGSIAKDVITMNSAAVEAETKAGRVGIWFGSYYGGSAQTALLKTNPKALLSVAPIPDGLDQGGTNAFFVSTVDPVYVVSSKCEHPEVLIKIANLGVQKQQYYANEEERVMYAGGFSKVQYTGKENAIINMSRPVAGYTDYKILAEAFETGDTSALNYNTMMDMYETMLAFKQAVDTGTVDPEDPVVMKGAGRWPTSSPVGAYAVIAKQEAAGKIVYNEYNATPSESMLEYQSRLNTQVGECIIRIILGEPVENYDVYLEKWYRFGGQEMIDDAQAWYDANR